MDFHLKQKTVANKTEVFQIFKHVCISFYQSFRPKLKEKLDELKVKSSYDSTTINNFKLQVSELHQCK